MIVIRAALELTIPAGVLPPTYNIHEQIILTGGAAVSMPTGAAFTPTASVYSTVVTWKMYYDGTEILAWNDGETDTLYALNRNNGIPNLLHYASVPGPVDLTSQVVISLAAVLPITIPTAALRPLFLQAFVEQGTNLGAAT
jgi:hypothetical protein